MPPTPPASTTDPDAPDALERLVNLALYFARARGAVSAEDVRAVVQGYPPGQDEAAFLRMFERDKEDLRAAGLAIATAEDDATRYLLDPEETYAGEVELGPDDALALRAVAASLAGDPAFPFGEDLRRAVLKLGGDLAEGAPSAVGRLACEDPERQGRDAAALSGAVMARKRVGFGYVNSLGEEKRHEVEPFGVFLREGRWYLVGRDVGRDEVRTYAAARMSALGVNAVKPKSPDFERPAGFDVSTYVRMPFQYGAERGEALLSFEPDAEWRAERLAPAGELTREGGSLKWRVSFGDRRRLLRWVIENGPGIRIEEPDGLASELRGALGEVAARHGS